MKVTAIAISPDGKIKEIEAVDDSALSGLVAKMIGEVESPAILPDMNINFVHSAKPISLQENEIATKFWKHLWEQAGRGALIENDPPLRGTVVITGPFKNGKIGNFTLEDWNTFNPPAKEKYLFVTEGGEYKFIVEDDPTKIDLKCVQNGTLEIIRLSDMKYLSPLSTMKYFSWEEIKKGKKFEDKDGDYHYI